MENPDPESVNFITRGNHPARYPDRGREDSGEREAGEGLRSKVTLLTDRHLGRNGMNSAFRPIVLRVPWSNWKERIDSPNL